MKKLGTKRLGRKCKEKDTKRKGDGKEKNERDVKTKGCKDEK